MTFETQPHHLFRGLLLAPLSWLQSFAELSAEVTMYLGPHARMGSPQDCTEGPRAKQVTENN